MIALPPAHQRVCLREGAPVRWGGYGPGPCCGAAWATGCRLSPTPTSRPARTWLCGRRRPAIRPGGGLEIGVDLPGEIQVLRADVDVDQRVPGRPDRRRYPEGERRGRSHFQTRVNAVCPQRVLQQPRVGYACDGDEQRHRLHRRDRLEVGRDREIRVGYDRDRRLGRQTIGHRRAALRTAANAGAIFEPAARTEGHGSTSRSGSAHAYGVYCVATQGASEGGNGKRLVSCRHHARSHDALFACHGGGG
jgi:hypothetical protein